MQERSNLAKYFLSRSASLAVFRALREPLGESVFIAKKLVESAGQGLVVQGRLVGVEHQQVFSAFIDRDRQWASKLDDFLAEIDHYRQEEFTICEYLADQLLLPLALAGGEFLTGDLSLHSRTNIEIIERFLGDMFAVNPREKGFVVKVNKADFLEKRVIGPRRESVNF